MALSGLHGRLPCDGCLRAWLCGVFVALRIVVGFGPGSMARSKLPRPIRYYDILVSNYFGQGLMARSELLRPIRY